MGKEAALRAPEPRDIDPVDLARAEEYGLLAALIARPPDRALLDDLARMAGDATALGAAHARLAAAAREADPAAVAREHFGLFVGVGRGEVLPFGSYYRTGFLNDRPLAELRADLARLGIERSPGVHDPEDHVAILCDVMAGLATGAFDAPPDAERAFFERHLEPWAERFFADLERAAGARFYRAVGGLGAVFMAIEAEAFGLDGAADGR